jgi:hypothetical protein
MCRCFRSLLLAVCFVSPPAALAQFPALPDRPSQPGKVDAIEAGVTTTDNIAAKAAQLYCNYVASGISPAESIKQADSEVISEVRKIPDTFNPQFYLAVRNQLIKQSICPRAPIPPSGSFDCSISAANTERLRTYRNLRLAGVGCLVDMRY